VQRERPGIISRAVLICDPGTVSISETGADQLRSVLLMLRFHGDRFAAAVAMLAQLRQLAGLKKILPASAHALKERSAENARNQLRSLASQLSEAGLTMSSLKARSLVDRIKADEPLSAIEFSLDELHSRIVDELTLAVVLVIPPNHLQYYQPAEPLFGTEVAARFPRAIVDIEEAGKCFALGRFTACVFHLMRVVEAGLGAISRSLNIVKHSPTWEAYLTVFQAPPAAKFPDKTAEHKRLREFYASVEAHLRAIKTAWRNPTMHDVEAIYTEEMALDIYNAVRGFMRHLAVEGVENLSVQVCESVRITD